jgi:hypothetical protein
MKKLLAVAVAGLVALAAAGAREKAKGKEVKYKVRDGHFVAQKSLLKKDASYLAFTDAKAFKKAFGKLPSVARKKSVGDDDFKTGLVVAIIKQGRGDIKFKVDKVTADGGTLIVRYKADMGIPYRAKKLPSLVALVVDRGKYNSVAFLENGKKVKTVKINK